MTGSLLDQAGRLDRAERRWLADARERLQRIREVRTALRRTEAKR